MLYRTAIVFFTLPFAYGIPQDEQLEYGQKNLQQVKILREGNTRNFQRPKKYYSSTEPSGTKVPRQSDVINTYRNNSPPPGVENKENIYNNEINNNYQNGGNGNYQNSASREIIGNSFQRNLPIPSEVNSSPDGRSFEEFGPSPNNQISHGGNYKATTQFGHGVNFVDHGSTFSHGPPSFSHGTKGFNHESPDYIHTSIPSAFHSGGLSSFASGSSFGHNRGFGSSFGGGGYDYEAHDGGGGGYNQAPIIKKSIYVHVAPPEYDDVPKQKIILPKIPPKKNFQIIFIKAPTPPPPSAPVIPPFPTQSDKTLIYVLHPKPEEAPPIHIPAPPENVQIKPEVYFIRYKGKGNNNKEENDVEEDDFGAGYRRRYSRDDDSDLDETTDLNDKRENNNNKDTQMESDVPQNDDEERNNDEQTDNSGESSNIIFARFLTTERGKNAH